ncbi:MAG TPA: hypothetical protein VFX12_03390 [Vicinamibacterales bacterium]|nr:hypothetical protein [Vicinamibacterales bacterium]
MTARQFSIVVPLVWVFAAHAVPADAQTSSATLNVTIAPLARLSVSANAVTFPDADPDVIPQVPAVGGDLAITAKSRVTPGSVVLLTVQATDDLRSGVDLIPVSALSWTASGVGFVAGTLGTGPVTLASWSTSGVRSGTQAWSFRNLWTYATGTYSASIVYTLSAP